jgi:hypothetical protein
LWDKWRCVVAHPALCLDLKLVCVGTRSAGYQQPKFDFFKTHKNLYMGPFCVSNMEFWLYDQEIRRFD